MTRNSKLNTMLISALLCSIGIVIPIISPIKITMEPASFTLASHVAIFIAMFISPLTAVFVSLGTSIGFLISGFPMVVVLRAATHVIFAFSGASLLKKFPDVLNSFMHSQLYSFVIGCIHAICEVAVVSVFYFGNNISLGYYSKGFFVSVILLVGVGTVVHSMIDFYLARAIWKPVTKAVKIQDEANAS